MNMSEEYLLTKEGYEKLEAELEDLVVNKRKEVSEKIKEALSYGDISENAEYDAAKNEQADMEERIHTLEEMLRKAKIIDESEVASDTISVGKTVKVKNMKLKEEAEYTIVGATEADPFAGRISNECAVGRALIGHKVGQTVEIEVYEGEKVKFKILDVK
ncbi:MAG: transcription elongation factor GreA [Firmicutes bacterium]|nr:transcription elongation factor GreA [Bacillota bacterium]